MCLESLRFAALEEINIHFCTVCCRTDFAIYLMHNQCEKPQRLRLCAVLCCMNLTWWWWFGEWWLGGWHKRNAFSLKSRRRYTARKDCIPLNRIMWMSALHALICHIQLMQCHSTDCTKFFENHRNGIRRRVVFNGYPIVVCIKFKVKSRVKQDSRRKRNQSENGVGCGSF